jgi:hypothetical protein
MAFRNLMGIIPYYSALGGIAGMWLAKSKRLSE